MVMNSSCEQIFDQSEDLFDRLPDEIVRSIFIKLQDAKSLCSSMSVCKRFHSIAPQVDRIFLPVPLKKAPVKESDQETHKNGFFKNIVVKTLMKPFNFISQVIKSKSKNDDDLMNVSSYHVPKEVLNSFQEIRDLHLRLPCQKLCSKTGTKHNKNSTTTFLKWKAEFGQELHSCVMLGAKSKSKIENPNQESKKPEESVTTRQSVVMGQEELKLRIVWTISCLIAASARHYLIQETVKSQNMIQNVVVSDESDQGKLCMNRAQIEEVKNGKGDGVLEYRSRVPALRMKMWYLERLELPGSGEVMEGATLVVIRPNNNGGGGGGGAEEGGGGGDGDLVEGWFGEDKVLGEAVRKLMVAKRCYTLEMNSF